MRLSRLVLAVAVLGLVLGCSSGKKTAGSPAASPTTPDLREISSSLAPFAEIAVDWSKPLSVQVGPQAQTVDLEGGARIQVPAGAFAQANELQATVIAIDLVRLGIDVPSGRVYAIKTAKDTGALPSPVVLQLPAAAGERAVAELLNGKLQRLTLTSTGGVEIKSFSEHLIVDLAGSAANVGMTVVETIATFSPFTTRAAANNAEHRARIEKGTPDTQAFYGVNETTSRTHDAMCAEFQTLLAAGGSKLDISFPAQYGQSTTNYSELARFLFRADVVEGGGYFWDLTKASIATIESKVLAHDKARSGPLSPAAYLQIAIDANNGNVALGVLAAHNYLKDITYAGRDSETLASGTVSPKQAGPMSRLETWRRSSSTSPAGFYDKGGSLYHIFASMTAAVWGPTGLRQTAVTGEALLRVLGGVGIFGDVPDPEKGKADQCGSSTGAWILTNIKPQGPTLTLIDQTISPPRACQVNESNVRAGIPFTQRCTYDVTVRMNYSIDPLPARIFCSLGPNAKELQLSNGSGAASVTVMFDILVQPGIGLGRPLSPSGCFIESLANTSNRASFSLQTLLPGP